MMDNLGQYIVIEGTEGAGKTTALKTVKKYLAAHNISAITAREPGATPVGETIRSLLKDNQVDLDARTELLLFYAARIELLQKIIQPNLQQGNWVISDRCELSSFAYQGGGRKLDASIFPALSDFCVGKLQPDLLIFLDISPELGLERARSRGKLDRIEQEPLEFFRDVHTAYHKYLQNYNNVAIIDASLPIAVVQRIIREKLHETIARCGKVIS